MNRLREFCPTLPLAMWVALTAILPAAVKCPPVFGSHMVLQRDQAIPVWGTASPGEKITVDFAGVKTKVTAGRDGTWRVKLPPLAASAEPQALLICGTNELRFEDVLVGEVWLCSGQSNMEKPLGERKGQRATDNAEEEIRTGSVVVSSNRVRKPVAVRLGWNERANPNLVNVAGLPARAFRTDDWPVNTHRSLP